MIKIPSTVLLLLCISGCATTPALQAPVDPVRYQAHLEKLQAMMAFQLSGRIGVRYDNEGFSGAIRWQHTALEDNILILSPLGQGVARIVRDKAGVTLTTSQQEIYHDIDAESLTQAVLGWRLPLQQLQYWVLGRDAPALPAQKQWNGDNQLSQLQQGDWQITYSDYQEVRNMALPGKIIIHHQRAEIKLIVNRWEFE